jgi:hypothetical protein
MKLLVAGCVSFPVVSYLIGPDVFVSSVIKHHRFVLLTQRSSFTHIQNSIQNYSLIL